MIVFHRTVAPEKLTPQERDDLSRQLYEVHCRIFSGVSAEAFRRHVIEPDAERTVIQTFLATDGRIVGYCAVHRFRRRVRGRNVLVLRAEAGLLPEYRGRGMTYGFGIVFSIVEKFKHPFTPIYYLGTLVHTSSYHLFCKYFRKIFPSPDTAATEDVESIALELIESFPDPAVEKTDPFIRDVGWTTIETPQEKELNQRKDRPDVAFFKNRNPGYTLGHGLVVLVPMTFSNVFGALMTRCVEVAAQTVTRHQPEI